MTNHKTLTNVQIRYLLQLKELAKEGEGVRSVQLAKALTVSKPSVHTMFNTFRDMRLITKDAYGSAFLSAEGAAMAARYERYYTAVYQVLLEHFPACDALPEAVCLLLAKIPQQDLEQVWQERRK